MRRLLWCLALLPIFLVGSCSTDKTTPRESLSRADRAATVSPAPISRPKPLAPDAIHILGVTAKVDSVQLKGSEIVPPSDPRVLGWWGREAGSKRGVTLLVGHTVHTGGGVLDNLEDVSVGRVLTIYGGGHQIQYKVISNKIISKTALAQNAQHLFSQTGPPKLVVVTCEDYNWSTGVYASNVVTIAKEVSTS